MAVNHQSLLKKLKQKVKELQRKEEHAQDKLHDAMHKLRKIAHVYKHKLAIKKRLMKDKIAKARTSTYAKVLEDIERQILKGIESKGKALTSAITKFEKKHLADLTRKVVKKAKRRSGKKK